MGKLTINYIHGAFYKWQFSWKITMFHGKTHYQWPCSIAFCSSLPGRVGHFNRITSQPSKTSKTRSLRRSGQGPPRPQPPHRSTPVSLVMENVAAAVDIEKWPRFFNGKSWDCQILSDCHLIYLIPYVWFSITGHVLWMVAKSCTSRSVPTSPLFIGVQHISTCFNPGGAGFFHVFYHPWLSQKRENPYAPCMVDLPTLGSLRG